MARVTYVGALISLHFTSQFPFKIKTSRKVKLLVRFIDFSGHSLVVNHKDIKRQNQLLLNIVMTIVQYIRPVLLRAIRISCVVRATQWQSLHNGFIWFALQ